MANPNPQSGFKVNPQNINKSGRPKRDWTWADLYEDAVNENANQGKGKVKQVVAKRLAKMAAKGDVVAIKELANRMDGMPQQKLDHTTKGEKIPIMGGSAKV